MATVLHPSQPGVTPVADVWTVVKTVDFKSQTTVDLTASGDTTYTLSGGQDVISDGTSTGDVDLTNGTGIVINKTSGGHTAIGILLSTISGYVLADDNVVQWIVKIDDFPQTGSSIGNCLAAYMTVNDATSSPFAGNWHADGFTSTHSGDTNSHNFRTACIAATGGLDAGAITTDVVYDGYVLFTMFLVGGGEVLRAFIETRATDTFVAPEDVTATPTNSTNQTAASDSLTGMGSLVAWLDAYDPGSAMQITITQFRLLTRTGFPS